MPPGFDYPTNLQPRAKPPDVWIPIVPDAARGSHNYRVVGRLKTGHTIAQAQSDMERVIRIVAVVDPGHRGCGAAVAGLQQHTVTAGRPALLLLMGAIVLVLLIACANVSGLLLARGATRQREVALRLALGAAPWRVMQQGLIEGIVLALVGAAAGLLVAVAGIRLLVELAPALPLVKEATLDARVLAFTILTALATGVTFGLAPTLQALKGTSQRRPQRRRGPTGWRRPSLRLGNRADRWRSGACACAPHWSGPLRAELCERAQRGGRLRSEQRPHGISRRAPQ